MLLKFRFMNYKCFKEMQEFSFIAGNTRSYEERLYKEKDFSVLKFAAIYGANGAGKSIAIDALRKMQNLVCIGLPKYIIPMYYKMDEESKKNPSYFEVILFFDGITYSYGFEYDSNNNKFTSEWLTILNKNGKHNDIFTRNLLTEEYYCDHKCDERSSHRMAMYLDDLKCNNEKLFLSQINDNKNSVVLESNEELVKIYDWFINSLSIIGQNAHLFSGEYLIGEKKIKELCSLLTAFGTGIKAIDSIRVDNDTAMHVIPAQYIDKIKEENTKLKDSNKKYKLVNLFLEKNNLWKIISDDDISFFKICFFHDEEKKYPFSLYEESEGTTRLIDLASVLLTDQDNQVFVIDEIDRKLHPQITCKFVQLFLEKAKKMNNQLIVTTHESRLLDFDILRRDEIYFVNKDEKGCSEIYSLDDFNVRFDKKIDKAYLDGRYGGVPIFDTVFPTINKKCHE